MVELPLNIVMGDKNIKIFSPYYIKPVRKALRKIGILKEKRGKIKKEIKLLLIGTNLFYSNINQL